MFQIIKERKQVTETSYEMNYYRKLEGSGDEYDKNFCYSYPCNEKGVIDKESLCKEAAETYEIVSADDGYVPVFEKIVHRYTEPAQAKCRGGNIFTVKDMFYGCCECDACGQWYNLFGQEVIPPDEQRRCYDW